MLRLLFWAFFLVLLCAVPPALAQQTKPDLIGHPVVTKGECTHDGLPRFCYLVKKQELLYLVVWDRQGEESIFRVKQLNASGTLGDEDLELLWSRNSA